VRRETVTRSAPATTEEKVNPAFAGVTMFDNVPQPHTMPRNYKNYADQGYAANDSVFKCCQYILTNGAAIPPVLYTDASKETEIKSHPLLDKLAQPNPEQDGVTFREAILGWYLIAGNAFIYTIRKGTAGPPDEMWVLDPNKVHPLPSATQGIIGYKYDDFEAGNNIIPAVNIMHLKTWNPKDPIFGLSAVEVAALMIDQQNATRKWNLALTQNMAKPSGTWVTDTPLAKNERDRLEEKLNEKLASARNAGRVTVIDAGAKWVPTGLPPTEMDWLESQKYNSGQIANLYNIPPQLVGDTSATTYNNMGEAKEASYTEAIFPALDKMYSLLTMRFIPMYPDLVKANNSTACLYYDKTTVEVVQNAIQMRANAEAQRAGQLYMQGAITLNRAQEIMGQPDLGPSGEVYRIGAVLVPADKLLDYAEQSMTEPAAPPMPEPEPITAPPTDGTPPATGKEPPETTPPNNPDNPKAPEPDDAKPEKPDDNKKDGKALFTTAGRWHM
jgi:HK97 family phage portal protein